MQIMLKIKLELMILLILTVLLDIIVCKVLIYLIAIKPLNSEALKPLNL